MIENHLSRLGEKIAELRIAKSLKQSELAYEAGISERTLQRIEAGDVVKSDGLVKVISYLDRLEQLLAALETPNFSPYELATAKRGKPPQSAAGSGQHPKRGPKSRVRHSDKQKRVLKKPSGPLKAPGKILWPEDQA